MSAQEADDNRRKLSQRVGEWGENFVAQCLVTQGWIVTHRRWRCRWGELDIVAQAPPPVKQILFVEVKVRGDASTVPNAYFNNAHSNNAHHSWDQGGLLAITPAKQQKLILASQAFLASHPALETYNCRFDVALVTHKRALRGPLKKEPRSNNLTSHQVKTSVSPIGNDSEDTGIDHEAFEFSIQHYIQGAFEAE